MFIIDVWQGPKYPSDSLLQLPSRTDVTSCRMLQGIIYLVRTQIFQKTNIAYPLICTRTCEYHWVRNISSSENFAYALNK